MTVRPPRPRWNERDADSFGWMLVVALVLVLLAGWVLASWIEARSFESVTGKHVSTWDAMFLDLRVQEPAR